ncbi:MAG: AbrB/MazE/SpoVT family DNA-binding domain-containing protein [Trueperaceae bacterium]|nr:AbrB/MazE/SpoVT family DNA-binding domain-containing protein [Trueperaceae bacterium]
MSVIRLGKKGQVSIPRSVLSRLGLSGDEMLLVETSEDGAIVLRPAGVYPLEVYDERRIEEFLQEDEMPPELGVRLRRTLEDRAGE